MSSQGFISKVRLPEVALMTGFALVGLPFTEGALASMDMERWVFLAAANALFVIAVYAANSYVGYSHDGHNPRLAAKRLSSPTGYLALAISCLAASMLSWWKLRPASVPLAAAFFLLWLFYSHPRGAKGRPILGTIVHFVGLILQFHLVALLFSGVSLKSLAVSAFFGLLFSGGHLMHEVRDHASDAKAGVETSAVRYGVNAIVGFYRWMLTGTATYWGIVWAMGMTKTLQFAPFFLASVLHCWVAWTARARFRPGSDAFRAFYRALYLLAGAFVFAFTIKYPG